MNEWNSVRLGDHAETYAGGTPDRGIPWLFGGSIAWVKSSELNFGRIRKTEEFLTQKGYLASAARMIPAGTVLVAMYGATAAQTAFLEIEACANQAVLAISPDKSIDSLFLYYALTAAKRRLLYQAQGSGQPNLNKQIIDSFRLAVPSRLSRQRRIAEILSTLDETIEQTEALIAKYQQIKAGLMQDLFTRGVTPDGRLRPTRTQATDLYKESALGWIPKEWHVKPLSELSHFITSGSRGWAEYYSNTGALFLRIGNLTRDHINFRWDEIARVSLPRFTEGQRTSVIPNDILISITADLGIVAVAPEGIGEAYVNQHIALVRPRFGRDIARFIGRLISTGRVQRQFLRLNDSGAKAGLNLPAVGRIVLSVPSGPAEVARITSILDLADENIDRHQQEAAKLRQQKHGLMHDLLTGRVHVPDVENKF